MIDQPTPARERKAAARILRTVANDLDAIRSDLARALATGEPGPVIVAAEVARAQLVYRLLGLRDTIDQLERKDTPK